MTINLILGSIRANRESEKPAFYIASKLRERGHLVELLDLREMNLPLFNDSPEQTQLPAVIKFIDAIQKNDGTIAVFPEYNHSYGSAFKNAMDFLRNREFMHRPLGLVGVSDGQFGGVRALFAARASLPTLGAVILPTVVPVPLSITTFPNAEHCTDPKVDSAITKLILEMEAYFPALAQVREQLKK